MVYSSHEIILPPYKTLKILQELIESCRVAKNHGELLVQKLDKKFVDLDFPPDQKSLVGQGRIKITVNEKSKTSDYF